MNLRFLHYAALVLFGFGCTLETSEQRDRDRARPSEPVSHLTSNAEFDNSQHEPLRIEIELGGTFETEVVQDVPFVLHWTAVPPVGVGTLGAYLAWCSFLGEGEDWSLWKRYDQTDPIVLGPEHAGDTVHFYLKTRDVLEDPKSERITHIALFVVPPAFDRFALVVDDAKFATHGPTDSDHDTFLRATIASRLLELGTVHDIAIFPPQGMEDERANPAHIPLAFLMRYRVVLWQTNHGAGSYETGLFQNANALRAYLHAGGRLFLVGGQLSAHALAPQGDFKYPKDPPQSPDPDFTEQSFPWEVLRYRNQIVSVPSRANGPLHEASGMVAAIPLATGFPEITLDLTKWNPHDRIEGGRRFRGGINSWEGVLGTFPPDDTGDGFDSLYVVKTFDESLCCGSIPSGLGEAVVAQRYLPEPSNLSGGRIAVFNFQPWYFEAEPLREAGHQTIDWLLDGVPLNVAPPDRGDTGYKGPSSD